jgi:protein-S-isoprenylcysteine O-methyltransferase Ste14
MRGNGTYLLQVIHEWQHQKTSTTRDKWWLLAGFVGLGLVIISLVMTFVTGFNPFWAYLVLALALLTVAIAIAYVIWRIVGASNRLKANAAAGIPSDPPTPADTIFLVYIGLAVVLIVVGIVVGLLFQPTWLPQAVIGLFCLELVFGALWARKREQSAR